MTPLLDVENLHVSYATRRRDERVRAVDGVSFAVGEGETLGLIGESGSGKSTLGRALMRLVRPTAGTARLRGTDLLDRGGRAGREMSAHLQMVFQDPHASLDPRMRVLASIEEPLAIRRDERGRRRARALELLDLVGLSRELGGRYPHELSGGQKQRVNIARALVLDPALVVCDEAVSALDVALQAEILELLATLQSELGLAYLFITHDLSVVAHIADRVAVMYLGRLVELGPVDQLVTRPRHPYTEALVSAQPRVDGDAGRERIVLQGDIPSPVHPPSGCRFRTRCRYATRRCAEEEPPWREPGPGHRVACHHADTLELAGVGS